jgi:hypothetical protein
MACEKLASHASFCHKTAWNMRTVMDVNGQPGVSKRKLTLKKRMDSHGYRHGNLGRADSVSCTVDCSKKKALISHVSPLYHTNASRDSGRSSNHQVTHVVISIRRCDYRVRHYTRTADLQVRDLTWRVRPYRPPDPDIGPRWGPSAYSCRVLPTAPCCRTHVGRSFQDCFDVKVDQFQCLCSHIYLCSFLLGFKDNISSNSIDCNHA